jgi:hypothetical protein
MHEPQHAPSPAGEEAKAGDSSALDEAVVELLQLAGNERAARLAQLAAAEPQLAQAARRRLGVLDDHGLLCRPASPEPAVPQQIGCYRILRRLGSGGMGVVWLAEQPALRRTVALKVLHEARLYSERARERFRREAMAAARLDHPGLCAVYEVGETGGVPFLAMRYVPGRTLAELVTEARARGQEAVALGTQSADSKPGGSGERATPCSRSSSSSSAWPGQSTARTRLASCTAT